MSDMRSLIEQAVAEGRVTRVPEGATGIVRKTKPDETSRFHPDTCGKGERIDRAMFLDEIDGEPE